MNEDIEVTITRDNVDKLKSSWAIDPCWDLRNTEGFEEYRDELIEFEAVMNERWEKQAEERRTFDYNLNWAVAEARSDAERTDRRSIMYSLIAIATELHEIRLAIEKGNALP